MKSLPGETADQLVHAYNSKHSNVSSTLDYWSVLVNKTAGSISEPDDSSR